MEEWQAFQNARLRDLQEAWQLGTEAVQQGRLPEQVPQSVALTAGAVLALGGSVLLVPRLRRLAWNTVDTTLAVLLLAFLVLFVLLLPAGACALSVWRVGGERDCCGASTRQRRRPCGRAFSSAASQLTHPHTGTQSNPLEGAAYLAFKMTAFVVGALCQAFPQLPPALRGTHVPVEPVLAGCEYGLASDIGASLR